MKKLPLLALLSAALLLAACGGQATPSASSAPSGTASSSPAGTDSAAVSESQPAPEPDGSCGEDVTWRLDGHTLILSGTGPTYDYSNLRDGEHAPWREDNEDEAGDVREVVIEPGITRIGTCLFLRHTNLLKVTIPDTVTEIGNSAFSGCEALTAVELPESLIVIDHNAFVNCMLGIVTIPENVKTVGQYAFDYNPISSVTIAGRDTFLDWDVFRKGSHGVMLTDVYYAGSEEEWNALEKGSLNWEGLNVHYNSTGE